MFCLPNNPLFIWPNNPKFKELKPQKQAEMYQMLNGFKQMQVTELRKPGYKVIDSHYRLQSKTFLILFMSPNEVEAKEFAYHYAQILPDICVIAPNGVALIL